MLRDALDATVALLRFLQPPVLRGEILHATLQHHFPLGLLVLQLAQQCALLVGLAAQGQNLARLEEHLGAELLLGRLQGANLCHLQPPHVVQLLLHVSQALLCAGLQALQLLELTLLPLQVLQLLLRGAQLCDELCLQAFFLGFHRGADVLDLLLQFVPLGLCAVDLAVHGRHLGLVQLLHGREHFGLAHHGAFFHLQQTGRGQQGRNNESSGSY